MNLMSQSPSRCEFFAPKGIAYDLCNNAQISAMFGVNFVWLNSGKGIRRMQAVCFERGEPWRRSMTPGEAFILDCYRHTPPAFQGELFEEVARVAREHPARRPNTHDETISHQHQNPSSPRENDKSESP